MRADNHVAHALAEFALARAEGLARSFKRIASAEEIEERERHGNANIGRPVAAVEIRIVPPFHVADHARQEVRFEPCFEALVVARERVVVMVVAAENPRLHVAIKAGNEEADLGVPAFERGFQSAELLHPRPRRCHSLHVRGTAGPLAGVIAREDVVARREVVVEAGIHPAGQDFRAEADRAKLVVELTVDGVVENISAEDDVVIRHQIAHAKTVAGLILVAVVVGVTGVQENGRVARPPERRDRVHVDSLQVLAELPAEGEGPGDRIERRDDFTFGFVAGRTDDRLAGLGGCRSRHGDEAERQGDGCSYWFVHAGWVGDGFAG